MEGNEPFGTIDPDHFAYRYGHLELLRDVDLTAVRHLLEQCTEVEVAAGETVLVAGAENDAAYLVVNGELEVRLVDQDAPALLTVGSGACVGELSILSRLNVSAYVVATERSRLFVIPEAILWSFVATSHEFAANLLALVSGRVREGNDRLLSSLDAQHRYQTAAKVDPLTGLYNRRWFDEIIERQWRRARAEGGPMSVMFIDIDDFKRINDAHGHLVGDQVLRDIAELLQTSIRPVDLAARFGGDEFAIVMFGITLPEAREIAERVRRDIEIRTVHCDAGILHVTASVGVAELRPGEGAREVLAACDAAMYGAKQDGRNRVMARDGAIPTVSTPGRGRERYS